MHCPIEVYWKQVNDYNQYIDKFSSIIFTKVLYGEQIPNHCKEGIHHQQHVRIIFEPEVTHEEATNILDELGLTWGSLTSEENKQCHADGGNIFTRPNYKGDWVLKAPCLDCYAELVRNDKDISKSFLLSYL
jgi:hypothetical protein